MQDHEDEATSADPNVQYAYEDGAGGADLDANCVRPGSVTYPGPSTRRVVYYNYPTSGVGAALSRLGNIAPSSGSHYADYTYLGAGTMVDANYPAVTGIPALTYGTRVNSYSGLDRFGRVVDQKWQNQTGGTVNDRFKYAYDRTSNRVSRDPAADSHTPPDANDNYYTYDGLDRLVKSNWGTLDGSGVIDDEDADANQAWGLDTVGNWSQFKWDAGTPTVQARTHNKANEIQAISGTNADWVDPAYDAAGNMTAGPQPRYEPADANTQWYKYDAWNRLARLGQGASSPGTLVATYSYDGLNRRIRKVVEAGETDITCDYYYNENWQVLEMQKAGRTNKTYQQYVWGAQYIDAPVVQFRDTADDGDLDQALYATYDGNFNVTGLVKSDGTVAERYTYDPYGKVTFKAADWTDAANQAKSAYDNEILYCGYRFDPESGNHLARRRYLTPPLGRWLATDPIVYGDGMNWYQYVNGMPLALMDPQGNDGVDNVFRKMSKVLKEYKKIKGATDNAASVLEDSVNVQKIIMQGSDAKQAWEALATKYGEEAVEKAIELLAEKVGATGALPGLIAKLLMKASKAGNELGTWMKNGAEDAFCTDICTACRISVSAESHEDESIWSVKVNRLGTIGWCYKTKKDLYGFFLKAKDRGTIGTILSIFGIVSSQKELRAAQCSKHWD